MGSVSPLRALVLYISSPSAPPDFEGWFDWIVVVMAVPVFPGEGFMIQDCGFDNLYV